MQLIFRFSIDPAKYGRRFGLDIPDDSMDDIAIGGGSLPDGETGEDEPTANDEAIAEDTEYSSNAPSRQCQTTIENCRAQNPLTCPYHGLKVLKQDIEGFLRQQGVQGQVEVVNDNQSQSGRKRNDFAAIINCEASQEGAVKAAMRQFFALPGIRGDARDVGYDDDDSQATGTFEIDLLDPIATRYTSGRNPTDSPAPAAEPDDEEVAEEVEEEEAPAPSSSPSPEPPAPAPDTEPTPTPATEPQREQSAESPAPERGSVEDILRSFESRIENFPDMSTGAIQMVSREMVSRMREALAAQAQNETQMRNVMAGLLDDMRLRGINESTAVMASGNPQSAVNLRAARSIVANGTTPQGSVSPAQPAMEPHREEPASAAESATTAPEPSVHDTDRATFMARNTRPELANESVPDAERDSLRAEVARAQENVRTLSQQATDQSLPEGDRTDASKVRNRYSSYGKSLRAILGGAGATNLDTATREEIARNAADWVKAVRESQVDARNEDGSFQTDENGRRVKRRNGTDNTAYKRAVDAANFIGSKLGFSIQDFDTGENGEAPAIAWTGEHPEHRLSFHDVEAFRAHRAALQAANGQSAQPQAQASASAAPAAPASAPAPTPQAQPGANAAQNAGPSLREIIDRIGQREAATPPPAATPTPPPQPAPAPAAEPTPSPAATTPAPEPQAQQAAPATASPSPAPSAAPAGRRNFASVARQAQQRRGGIQNANMASMLDRIRQRAQNLQNGANNG